MEPNTASAASITLPAWLVYLSAAITVASGIFLIIDIIIRSTTRGSFDAKLTREVFIRLLQNGECVYAHVSLISSNTSSLITGIKADLTFTNAQTVKKFPLNITQYGEKYRAESGAANYYFHSMSPTAFIPENIPQQIAIMCVHGNYSQQITAKFSNFFTEIERLKTIHQNNLDSFIAESNILITSTLHEIMEAIQLEGGKYKLEVTIEYKQKNKILSRLTNLKSTTTSIMFELNDSARNDMKQQIKSHLENLGLTIVTNDINRTILPAPQINPISAVDQ